jgi:hypothetical protein
MSKVEEELLNLLHGKGKEQAEEEPEEEERAESDLEEVHRIGRSPFTKSSAFQRRDAHPMVLDVLLLDRFGPPWLAWEPETIWHEVEQEFHVTPSVYARNKINAVKTLHLVKSPWTEWEVFTVVVQALTDNIPDFRTLQKPTPTQIIPAVNIIADINTGTYSEEVGRYIAACFLDEGVFYLPQPVEFAQTYAAMHRYRCTKCGNIDSDDDNEMCDSCGAPDSFLERTPTHDPLPIKNRFDEVVAAGKKRDFWLQEDVVDVQVAKLLLAQQRDVEYKTRLQKQMEAIRG